MEMNQFKNSPISESLTMRQSVRVILFPMEYLDKLIESELFAVNDSKLIF